MSPTAASLDARVQMPDVFGAQTAIRVDRSSTVLPIIGERYVQVRLKAITHSSPMQTREAFNPAHDEVDQALVESLRARGQIVPVLLIEIPEALPPRYQLLDGHRRVEALRQLGAETVKAVVQRAESREADLATLTAHVRKNLSPVEWAQAIRRLRQRHQLPYDDIRQYTGLSVSHMSELVRMLDAAPEVLAQVNAQAVSIKGAVELSTLPPPQQVEAVAAITHHGLNRAESRQLAQRTRATGAPPAAVAESIAAERPRPQTRPGSAGSVATAGSLLRDGPPDFPADRRQAIMQAAGAGASADLHCLAAWLGQGMAEPLVPAQAVERAQELVATAEGRMLLGWVRATSTARAFYADGRMAEDVRNALIHAARQFGEWVAACGAVR